MKGDGWNEALAAFPREARDALSSARADYGRIDGAEVARICRVMGIDIGALMILLLPLAAQYAIDTQLPFKVGAVSQGMPRGDEGLTALYLGSNVEYLGQALSFTTHAEQSATVNAWMHDEPGIQALAISAAPCGYCRQFLYELVTAETLSILLPTGDGAGYTREPLTHYLPDAFGPHDLGVQGGLMNPKDCYRPLTLEGGEVGDPLVMLALEAAEHSYAPYTDNFSGCAVALVDGRLYGGRYGENAAFNPSISPLESALTFMNQAEPLGGERTVVRAVLVENPTKASQRGATVDALAAFAPGVELEYRIARPA